MCRSRRQQQQHELYERTSLALPLPSPLLTFDSRKTRSEADSVKCCGAKFAATIKQREEGKKKQKINKENTAG